MQRHRRLQLELLALLDQRAHPVDLRARLAALTDVHDDLRAALLADEPRDHRRSPRWQLVQHRDVEVRVERHRERARDRRRAHHQLVRLGEPLAAQREPLGDTEPVLLVDDRQPQPGQSDAFLEQRVRADRELRLAGREPLLRSLALLRRQRSRQPRDLDREPGEPR